MWDQQFGAFAQRHRVVRYDIRGIGASASKREADNVRRRQIERFQEGMEIRAVRKRTIRITNSMPGSVRMISSSKSTN